MSGLLYNKVALITGAASGLGRCTALQLAAEGARVVVSDVNDAEGEQTVEQIRSTGGEAKFVHADVSDASDCEHMVRYAQQQFGALHVAINNAARSTATLPITDIEERDYQRCVDICLKGVWLGMKYQLPAIEASGGGAIVNVASASGHWGQAFQAVYAATKAAVIVLSKSAAAEYAKRGVRVNTVSPGGIDSPGMQYYLKSVSDDIRDATVNVSALGRFATPAEIANGIIFLASDKASYITGEDYKIDGGIEIKSYLL